MKIKETHFYFVFVVLLGTVTNYSSGCELLFEENVPFLFSEVDENYKVGTKLPDCLRIKKEPDEIIDILGMNQPEDGSCAWEYVSAIVKDDCIEFYLLKNLSAYRMEKWEPSLESEFRLRCSPSNESVHFTHLLLIKDDNLYEPKFTNLHEEESYNGLLYYTKLHGFHLRFNSTENDHGKTSGAWIHIKDYDFNPQHANVSVSCNGLDCQYFDFNTTSREFDEGYNFDIHVDIPHYQIFRDNVKDGQYLNFKIIADDGLNSAKAQVSIYVSMAVDQDNENSQSNNNGSAFPTVPTAIGAGVMLLILLLCTGTLSYFMIRSRKSKDIVRKLTEAEIREFLEGTPNLSGDIGKRSVDVNTPIMAMPYNQAFEIPRERLRIDETTILGTGAFGVVWKGSVVFSNGDGITVAVKSIKRNVGVLYFKALLSELKIMAYIGKHPNIVSLVGACTHNIRKREVYIAVQYCANGNFHQYLKCRRERFANLVVNGTLQLTNAANYTNMDSSNGCFFRSISTMDLLRWSMQIVNGLQYLESLGVIHGDLATRNILLDSEKTAKIADFGLSRRLIDYNSNNYASNYYTKTTQAPLPWKWMAPESLSVFKFSHKSDVWSLGILLWEVFTLSQTPYAGHNWDDGFLEKLEGGMRPKMPSYATFELYDIMTDCWNLEPQDRPAILDIKRALEEITNSVLRQSCDSSYMRLLGDQPFITLMNEDEEGYLLPNDENQLNYVDI